ncbi:hypothetical protein [Paractinoplanes rishiriensis]|uniref:Uncharacterized protein n=1 Tax=Paractinoplanes rishiriensis TaxID=1050105 RepID=A0A919N0A1_9ACTN|nr:hypothetical protein [Actinoplanes rishiriensis]GIE99365.1 hypothetical protein Ari01nite_68300 [Actinoplanes rishiriensis]
MTLRRHPGRRADRTPGSLPLLRRLGLLLVAAGCLVAGWPAPAQAHAGGLVATDARGSLVSVTPAVPGLSVTALEDGHRLRLVNGTGAPVVVPGGGGAGTPVTVAAGDTLTWMDARSTPAGRQVAPGQSVPWSFVLDAGGTPVTVQGLLVGSAAPAAPIWWALTVAVAAGLVVLSRRVRRGDLLLAAAGMAAAGASIAHVVGSTLAVESMPLAGTFFDAAGINLLAWPLLAGGAFAVLRGRAAGVLAVCAGAALTAIFVLPDVTSFHRAVLPFGGPAVVERVLVVLALGAGAGVALAGGAVLRTLAQKASA